LFTVRPTRDLSFYLRFFEQYCISHPIVAPDGSAMLVPGARVEDDEDALPSIYEVPLDGGPVQELDEGVFAVYGPGAPT